jgi:hypothetical protein
MQLYTVRSQDRAFFIVTSGNKASLYERGSGLVRSFRTLPALLHTLGGMVDWRSWTDESRAILSHLNMSRGAI